MMRRLAAVCAACALATAGPAAAESVKLVTGNGWKPFVDQDLPEGGMATDLVRQAYKSINQDISIEFLPWKRGKRKVENHDIHGTFPYLKNAERAKKFKFSDPIMVVEARPFVTAENKGSISSYEDMKGKRLCLPEGYALSNDKLKEMVDSGEITRISPRNYTNCFRMLKRGRADFANAERPSGLNIAKDVFGSPGKVSAENLVLKELELRVMFSKNLENVDDFVTMANEALGNLRDSGQHEKIIQKHLQ